jgi:ABC-type Na+ efflux pump permease subunit
VNQQDKEETSKKLLVQEIVRRQRVPFTVSQIARESLTYGVSSSTVQSVIRLMELSGDIAVIGKEGNAKVFIA